VSTLDRSGSVGGSDVSAIMGISPFRTRLDVWREKVLGSRDDIDSPAIRAGTRFEPHILSAYRARLPQGATMWTPEPTVDGYRRCSPDALVEVAGWRSVVEAKATILAKEWGDDGSDGVPLHYVVQGNWYADHLKCDSIDFPVLQWPHEMRDLLGLTPPEIVEACNMPVLQVPFSPALAELVREQVDRFWIDHVLAEVPPKAVDLEDRKRLLIVTQGKTVPASEDLVRLLLERDAIREEIRAAKARDDANAFAIRELLDDAEAAIDPNSGNPLVTCKLVEKVAYTVKPQKYRELRMTKHWKEIQKP